MFAKPRPKKSILPIPNKKRKNTSAIEEINFDNDARHEYLTGFHKRKQQRIKHAQETAAKIARQERLETRKQVREERKREVADHVETVNRMLRESGAIVTPIEGASGSDEADEWDGFPDQPSLDVVDHEEEYIDEDRYTTVKVESVTVSRDGLEKPVAGTNEQDEYNEEDAEESNAKESGSQRSRTARPIKKKKKFRYESKFERQAWAPTAKAGRSRR